MVGCGGCGSIVGVVGCGSMGWVWQYEWVWMDVVYVFG